MSLTSAFCTAVYGAGHGLQGVFNFVTGSKALAKRYISRNHNGDMAAYVGSIAGVIGGCVGDATLNPPTGLGLAAFGGAILVGATVAAQLQAAYYIGKRKRDQRKPQRYNKSFLTRR